MTTDSNQQTTFGYIAGERTDGEIIILQKPLPEYGRYVKVQMKATQFLHICEVEVIGKECVS